MKWLLIAVVALLAGSAVLFVVATAPQTIAAEDLPAYRGDPARGEYVFYAGGCPSCHADPEAEGDDRLRLGGGEALGTPFGAFYAPNISPHPDGIGGWTDAEFVTALMRGVSPAGEHYYPSFPYSSYQNMRIEDALDLKAFIDALPPVAGQAPPHDLPPLFRLRRGIGMWKRAYMGRAVFAPDPAADERVNRGAYLVHALAHCGECHTPRDSFGGPRPRRAFAGGRAPEGDGTVPNITPHPDGIGDWSVEDIKDALRTGFLPGFETFGGAMAEVQKNMAMLTEADREAIALYLKSLPPLPDAAAE